MEEVEGTPPGHEDVVSLPSQDLTASKRNSGNREAPNRAKPCRIHLVGVLTISGCASEIHLGPWTAPESGQQDPCLLDFATAIKKLICVAAVQDTWWRFEYTCYGNRVPILSDDALREAFNYFRDQTQSLSPADAAAACRLYLRPTSKPPPWTLSDYLAEPQLGLGQASQNPLSPAHSLNPGSQTSGDQQQSLGFAAAPQHSTPNAGVQVTGAVNSSSGASSSSSHEATPPQQLSYAALQSPGIAAWASTAAAAAVGQNVPPALAQVRDHGSFSSTSRQHQQQPVGGNLLKRGPAAGVQQQQERPNPLKAAATAGVLFRFSQQQQQQSVDPDVRSNKTAKRDSDSSPRSQWLHEQQQQQQLGVFVSPFACMPQHQPASAELEPAPQQQQQQQQLGLRQQEPLQAAGDGLVNGSTEASAPLAGFASLEQLRQLQLSSGNLASLAGNSSSNLGNLAGISQTGISVLSSTDLTLAGTTAGPAVGSAAAAAAGDDISNTEVANSAAGVDSAAPTTSDSNPASLHLSLVNAARAKSETRTKYADGRFKDEARHQQRLSDMKARCDALFGGAIQQHFQIDHHKKVTCLVCNSTVVPYEAYHIDAVRKHFVRHHEMWLVRAGVDVDLWRKSCAPIAKNAAAAARGGSAAAGAASGGAGEASAAAAAGDDESTLARKGSSTRLPDGRYKDPQQHQQRLLDMHNRCAALFNGTMTQHWTIKDHKSIHCLLCDQNITPYAAYHPDCLRKHFVRRHEDLLLAAGVNVASWSKGIPLGRRKLKAMLQQQQQVPELILQGSSQQQQQRQGSPESEMQANAQMQLQQQMPVLLPQGSLQQQQLLQQLPGQVPLPQLWSWLSIPQQQQQQQSQSLQQSNSLESGAALQESAPVQVNGLLPLLLQQQQHPGGIASGCACVPEVPSDEQQQLLPVGGLSATLLQHSMLLSPPAVPTAPTSQQQQQLLQFKPPQQQQVAAVGFAEPAQEHDLQQQQQQQPDVGLQTAADAAAVPSSPQGLTLMPSHSISSSVPAVIFNPPAALPTDMLPLEAPKPMTASTQQQQQQGPAQVSVATGNLSQQLSGLSASLAAEPPAGNLSQQQQQQTTADWARSMAEVPGFGPMSLSPAGLGLAALPNSMNGGLGNSISGSFLPGSFMDFNMGVIGSLTEDDVAAMLDDETLL